MISFFESDSKLVDVSLYVTSPVTLFITENSLPKLAQIKLYLHVTITLWVF